MECPFCHAMNPTDSKFCGNCGKQLQVQCPSCGSRCIVSNKFCPQCGENINADIFWQNLMHYDNYDVYEDKDNADCIIRVELNHKYTFINPRVSIFPISDCEYEEAYRTWPFSTFWVKKSGKWGCINAMTGQLIHNCVYDKIEWCGDYNTSQYYTEPKDKYYPATACVKYYSKWGVIDTKGEHYIMCNYDEIVYRDHSYGCYIIKQNNKYGYIHHWALSISCKYDELKYYKYDDSCNFFIVCINGKYGVIDLSEKIIIDFIYDMIEFGSNGNKYILKKDGYYGFYYRVENRLVQCIYTSIYEASRA